MTKRRKIIRWPHDKRYACEVVGESFFESSISKIYNVNLFPRTKLFCEASLEPDPHNTHDRLAVKVLIEERQVGHLSAQDAASYHQAFSPDSAPTTVCSAVILSRDIDGERSYSVWLAMDINNPPGAQHVRSRSGYSRALPLMAPSIFRLNGRVMIVADGINPHTVDMCSHGIPLDVWKKPGTDDIHLFAPGSVGGSGRVAVLDTDILAAAGLTEDEFSPIVAEIGTHFLLLYADSLE